MGEFILSNDQHWALVGPIDLYTIHLDESAGNSESELPPKNWEIALWLPTNSLMCGKCVSQKRYECIDKNKWYNILLNFIS